MLSLDALQQRVSNSELLELRDTIRNIPRRSSALLINPNRLNEAEALLTALPVQLREAISDGKPQSVDQAIAILSRPLNGSGNAVRGYADEKGEEEDDDDDDENTAAQPIIEIFETLLRELNGNQIQDRSEVQGKKNSVKNEIKQQLGLSQRKACHGTSFFESLREKGSFSWTYTHDESGLLFHAASWLNLSSRTATDKNIWDFILNTHFRRPQRGSEDKHFPTQFRGKQRNFQEMIEDFENFYFQRMLTSILFNPRDNFMTALAGSGIFLTAIGDQNIRDVYKRAIIRGFIRAWETYQNEYKKEMGDTQRLYIACYSEADENLFLEELSLLNITSYPANNENNLLACYDLLNLYLLKPNIDIIDFARGFTKGSTTLAIAGAEINNGGDIIGSGGIDEQVARRVFDYIPSSLRMVFSSLNDAIKEENQRGNREPAEEDNYYHYQTTPSDSQFIINIPEALRPALGSPGNSYHGTNEGGGEDHQNILDNQASSYGRGGPGEEKEMIPHHHTPTPTFFPEDGLEARAEEKGCNLICSVS